MTNLDQTIVLDPDTKSGVSDDIVTVYIRFGVKTELGLYQDTIVLSIDEWEKRDQGEIDKGKQGLADSWVAFRKAQIEKEGEDQKVEVKKVQIVQLDEQITNLVDTKNRLKVEIASAEDKEVKVSG